VFDSLLSRIRSLQKYIDRPWYPYLVALLAAVDMFVLVIPTDGLLVSAVLLRPKRWARTFLIVTTGSALGALLLAWLFQHGVSAVTDKLVPLIFGAAWNDTEAFAQSHGALALALVAASPFPQAPAVVLAALADMPLSAIFLACWLGRGAKYALFAWSASHAPKLVLRLWGVRREINELGGPPGEGAPPA